MKKSTKIAMGLKTNAELKWFSIMPCASIYSVIMSIPKVFRMFQCNLEYTQMFCNEITNENKFFYIRIHSLMV